MVHKDAVKYKKILFDQVLKKNLRVMDLTAITLCKENNLPIQVFDIKVPGALKRLVLGEPIGTIVSE
jgi:uridylate kinase